MSQEFYFPLLPLDHRRTLQVWLTALHRYHATVPSQEPKTWSSCPASAVVDLTSIHEDTGSIPGLTQWLKDPALLWLWHRPSAVALIQPLAREIP